MQDLVKQLADLLEKNNMLLAVAESCTGGQLSAEITKRAGISNIFDRGFITYSNQAKQDMLGVAEDLLETYGAVSAQVAESMAKGTLQNSAADIALSITGIAGPTGATADKPVGLVYFGVAIKNQPTISVKKIFSGQRHEIQRRATQFALEQLISSLKDLSPL